MRFLCLHGKGTSASIFSSQTASFRHKLPPNAHTFDFIDGPFPSTPAAGIDLFYPPPFYSFYEGTSASDIRAAHTWLSDILARDGPYDGVMMFSQGCALVASMLLCQAAETPHVPPPFKCAIFICGGLQMDMLEDLGVDVTPEARDCDERSRKGLQEMAGTEAIVSRGADRWGTGPHFNAFDRNAEIKAENVFGLDFTRMPKELKIRIPTVHIVGCMDPRFPASTQLAWFCDERVRRMFDHGGGHDVPRRKDVSEAIAGLVEWAAVMGGKS